MKVRGRRKARAARRMRGSIRRSGSRRESRKAPAARAQKHSSHSHISAAASSRALNAAANIKNTKTAVTPHTSFSGSALSPMDFTSNSLSGMIIAARPPKHKCA